MYPKYLLLTLAAGVAAVRVPDNAGSSGALQAYGHRESSSTPPPRPTFPDTDDDDDESSFRRPRGRIISGRVKPRSFRESPSTPPPRPTFPDTDDDDDESSFRRPRGRVASAHVKPRGLGDASTTQPHRSTSPHAKDDKNDPKGHRGPRRCDSTRLMPKRGGDSDNDSGNDSDGACSDDDDDRRQLLRSKSQYQSLKPLLSGEFGSQTGSPKPSTPGSTRSSGHGKRSVNQNGKQSSGGQPHGFVSLEQLSGPKPPVFANNWPPLSRTLSGERRPAYPSTEEVKKENKDDFKADDCCASHLGV
ncbi:hypothetical protein MCOR27_007924 [Pyricularia oryzae]|uniref:Uncharacterized protein n=1 Tax=Pyricularia grisea TaxID=148305 RepID=A0ABQ8P1T8_PYRGI|nr:hypothetical protein MCOR01_001419 [Pyricularia oryzae]KAI6304248.1 hypothetical protein MCOR33_000763 [Pyricularia grisea]KAI6257016.1 hypothetical protein MCOR19_006526 [Pyricularia oryzae]KAI6273328.1 hypothetical protein MCOR27_007924 [Pyricularia oryzae]KAI6285912.1 hypothetical protein MCOR26_001288 [Pyricularia oryzae]